jgi:hypothetical protein
MLIAFGTVKTRAWRVAGAVLAVSMLAGAGPLAVASPSAGTTVGSPL